MKRVTLGSMLLAMTFSTTVLAAVAGPRWRVYPWAAQSRPRLVVGGHAMLDDHPDRTPGSGGTPSRGARTIDWSIECGVIHPKVRRLFFYEFMDDGNLVERPSAALSNVCAHGFRGHCTSFGSRRDEGRQGTSSTARSRRTSRGTATVAGALRNRPARDRRVAAPSRSPPSAHAPASAAAVSNTARSWLGTMTGRRGIGFAGAHVVVRSAREVVAPAGEAREERGARGGQRRLPRSVHGVADVHEAVLAPVCATGSRRRACRPCARARRGGSPRRHRTNRGSEGKPYVGAPRDVNRRGDRWRADRRPGSRSLGVTLDPSARDRPRAPRRSSRPRRSESRARRRRDRDANASRRWCGRRSRAMPSAASWRTTASPGRARSPCGERARHRAGRDAGGSAHASSAQAGVDEHDVAVVTDDDRDGVADHGERRRAREGRRRARPAGSGTRRRARRSEKRSRTARMLADAPPRGAYRGSQVGRTR